MKEMPVVKLYTDGACSGNPGPGGIGAILVCGDKRREISAGFQHTTNNRMELLAVISGLEALNRPCRVRVYSDSQYLVKAIKERWVYKWAKNGWMRTRTAPALNSDLWSRLLSLMKEHEVEFEWVRGHSGHPENERCDNLAVKAYGGRALLRDEGYRGEAK